MPEIRVDELRVVPIDGCLSGNSKPGAGLLLDDDEVADGGGSVPQGDR